MTREEKLHWLNVEIQTWENDCQSKHPIKEALYAASKALKQEPILEKDGTLIVTTEHYENVGRVLVQYGTNGALFYQDREPFINKPCISSKVCEHDKEVVLDKIRAEIESIEHYGTNDGNDFWLRTPDEIKKDVLDILNKYKAESDGYENWVN